jgi:sirohydrochlorin cobaltochelatase
LNAVIVIGHGSKLKAFALPMKQAIRELKRRRPGLRVSEAYLEINSPSIAQAVDLLVKKGARSIRVLPYFLLSGKHVKQHIPEIVRKAQAKHRGRVSIRLCNYLAYDPKIVDVMEKRIKK